MCYYLKAYMICRASPTPSAVLQLLHKETCCNQPPVICLPQKWNALFNKMFIITVSTPLFLSFYLHFSIRCLLLLVTSTWILQLILAKLDLYLFLWKTSLLEVMRHIAWKKMQREPLNAFYLMAISGTIASRATKATLKSIYLVWLIIATCTVMRFLSCTANGATDQAASFWYSRARVIVLESHCWVKVCFQCN